MSASGTDPNPKSSEDIHAVEKFLAVLKPEPHGIRLNAQRTCQCGSGLKWVNCKKTTHCG
jgi:hypothetical protein